MSTATTVFDAVDSVGESRRLQALVGLVVVVLLAIVPFLASGYEQRVITFVLASIILASGYNIIGGLAGYASFGHAVFLGMGAYTSAILMNTYNVPFFGTIPVAGVAAGLFALVTGLPILRLRGHYFAIATLGLQLAVMRTFGSLPFFGGGSGWPTVVDVSAVQFYFLFLTLAALTVGMVWLIKRSRFGFGLRALSLNEQQAEMVGIPTTSYKTAAYIASAIPVGLAGAMYAGWLNFINVQTVFAVEMSVNMILYVLLGGVGTLIGPVVGAIALEFINQTLWSRFPDLHILIYGILIVCIVLFLPGGLAELYEKARQRFGRE